MLNIVRRKTRALRAAIASRSSMPIAPCATGCSRKFSVEAGPPLDRASASSLRLNAGDAAPSRLGHEVAQPVGGVLVGETLRTDVGEQFRDPSVRPARG